MQHPRRRPRMPDHQLDFFLANALPTSSPVPGWNALPERTRQAVTRLVARLLMAHASGAGPQPGGDGDER